MKKVILGISGGIAAYKAAEVASLLVKAGCEVRGVMTKNAMEYITPLTIEVLTGHPIEREMYGQADSYRIHHINMTEDADCLLIAPATANILAKAAHGIGDDLLSTTILAADCPIVCAPAMNTRMWENPATQENVSILKKRGWHFVGPAWGRLACGTMGQGKLSAPEEIVAAAMKVLHPVQDLLGKSVIVTAGPTREKLDPVRYVTNFSSGKMGYALAAEARDRGADVTLISGPVSIEAPKGVTVVPVESTMDLYEACMSRFADADITIMAAAPADYRPAQMAENKIKKQKGEGLTVEFVENPDIAAALGAEKRADQVLVVFAAETQNLLAHAGEKLRRKNGDLMVANDVSRKDAGFHVDTNAVTLLFPDDRAPIEVPLMDKSEVAKVIVDQACAILAGKSV